MPVTCPFAEQREDAGVEVLQELLEGERITFAGSQDKAAQLAWQCNNEPVDVSPSGMLKIIAHQWKEEFCRTDWIWYS